MEETRNALDDDKVDSKEREKISAEVIELEKKIDQINEGVKIKENENLLIQKLRDLSAEIKAVIACLF